MQMSNMPLFFIAKEGKLLYNYKGRDKIKRPYMI